MTGRDDIWFARVPGRGKMVPITPEGRRVVWTFVAGMVGTGVVTLVLALGFPNWLWVPLMAAGFAASGIYFVATAYRHTDHERTLDDYRPRGNGGQDRG